MAEKTMSKDKPSEQSEPAEHKGVFQRLAALLPGRTPDTTEALEQEIQELLEAREKARAERQWELADRIRDELRVRRISVQDQKAPHS